MSPSSHVKNLFLCFLSYKGFTYVIYNMSNMAPFSSVKSTKNHRSFFLYLLQISKRTRVFCNILGYQSKFSRGNQFMRKNAVAHDKTFISDISEKLYIHVFLFLSVPQSNFLYMQVLINEKTLL